MYDYEIMIYIEETQIIILQYAVTDSNAIYSEHRQRKTFLYALKADVKAMLFFH